MDDLDDTIARLEAALDRLTSPADPTLADLHERLRRHYTLLGLRAARALLAPPEVFFGLTTSPSLAIRI